MNREELREHVHSIRLFENDLADLPEKLRLKVWNEVFDAIEENKNLEIYIKLIYTIYLLPIESKLKAWSKIFEATKDPDVLEALAYNIDTLPEEVRLEAKELLDKKIRKLKKEEKICSITIYANEIEG